MKNVTGSTEFDKLIREEYPNGLELKLTLEEYFLIKQIRDKETTTIEVKTMDGEISGINQILHFDTYISNAERILERYKKKGEVRFTPISGNNYHVKVVYRLK